MRKALLAFILISSCITMKEEQPSKFIRVYPKFYSLNMLTDSENKVEYSILRFVNDSLFAFSFSYKDPLVLANRLSGKYYFKHDSIIFSPNTCSDSLNVDWEFSAYPQDSTLINVKIFDSDKEYLESDTRPDYSKFIKLEYWNNYNWVEIRPEIARISLSDLDSLKFRIRYLVYRHLPDKRYFYSEILSNVNRLSRVNVTADLGQIGCAYDSIWGFWQDANNEVLSLRFNYLSELTGDYKR